MRRAVRVTGARALVVVVSLALAACSDIRSQTYTYATLDEAREAGAISRGWMPEGLPPGAYEIRVAFVPDTAERWGLFNFPPSERDHLERLVSTEEMDLDGLRPGVPGRIEWWPVALRGTLDGERLALTGLTAYRSRDGQLVVAVNWKQGRAYYWKAGGGKGERGKGEG